MKYLLPLCLLALVAYGYQQLPSGLDFPPARAETTQKQADARLLLAKATPSPEATPAPRLPDWFRQRLAVQPASLGTPALEMSTPGGRSGGGHRR